MAVHDDAINVDVIAHPPAPAGTSPHPQAAGIHPGLGGDGLPAAVPKYGPAIGQERHDRRGVVDDLEAVAIIIPLHPRGPDALECDLAIEAGRPASRPALSALAVAGGEAD